MILIYSVRMNKKIIASFLLVVILFVSAIAGTIVYYNNKISTLNSQISDLTGQVSNLSNMTQANESIIFEPEVGTSNFTSLLTMNTPASTPTGNYSVIVTAAGRGLMQNALCCFGFKC